MKSHPPKFSQSLPSTRLLIYNFTALLVLYVVLSGVVHLSLGNTIPNFLGYVFVIFPIHIIFLLVYFIGCLSAAQKRTYVHYQPQRLGIAWIVQSFVLFLTPSACLNWKQGSQCRSLIETLIVPTNHPSPFFSWGFAIALVLYLIAIVWFFQGTTIKRTR